MFFFLFFCCCFFFFLGGGGGQGRCERRIEGFVKVQKKKKFVGVGRVWEGSVRMDVIEELKFL